MKAAFGCSVQKDVVKTHTHTLLQPGTSENMFSHKIHSESSNKGLWEAFQNNNEYIIGVTLRRGYWGEGYIRNIYHKGHIEGHL